MTQEAIKYKNDLKLRRARAQMTGAELARKAGVTRDTIYRIENGLGRPSPVVQGKLAQALGIDVVELAGMWAS